MRSTNLNKNGHRLRVSIGAVTSLLLSGAQGAGFYIQEVGTPRSLGTAGVANATSTGADAAWSNPAGMAFIDQDQMFAGVQLVVPKVEFDPGVATAGGDDGGNAGIPTAVPGFFYVHKHSDRLRLGLSLAGTMGGGFDYGNGFAGRYSTIQAELGAVGLSPSLAYRVSERISVGAGVSILYTLFEQQIAINPALVPTVDGSDGRLKIEDADDVGYQPYFSLNYRFNNALLLSAVYRAEMDVELSGDVRVNNVALPIGADKVDIDWKNPQWLEAGLRYRYTDRDTLFVNAGWQDWSVFSENQLAFSGGVLNPVAQLDRNFKDTWHAGVAYAHQTARASIYSIGFSYDSSPVDDEDRTFDLPVEELFKLSGSYSWNAKKNLGYSLGATLYLVGDAPIDQTSQGVRVKGEFDTNAILFLGGTLRYVF